MAEHGTPNKSWEYQAAFREYVATRLDELVFAFSDHGLLAESIDDRCSSSARRTPESNSGRPPSG
jgi:hypothetical protein